MARAANHTKPRIYLADLEYAKKEELERRRKLRLKQVRQQARDIATVIRTHGIDARKRNEIASKCEQLNAELISDESKKAELESKLSDCLTSVGTGHLSATVLSEVDQLVQHRTELQETLARVRAELATEKNKDTRTARSEVVENPREGISISEVPSGKPAVRPTIKKYFPALSPSSSHSAPAAPPNLVSTKRLGSSESVNSEPVAEKTILSPPSASNSKPAVRTTDHSSNPNARPKSCPPVAGLVEAEGVSSDSDSGQTSPRASVKKKKPSKVRKYDHSAHKCSEYVQQSGVVRMGTPEGINMNELIHEEEHLISRKMDEELENSRVKLQRGVRALREEMAKQDWDSAITKLCQFAKEKRIKKSLTYPSESIPEESQSNAEHPEKEVGPKTGQGESKTRTVEDFDTRNAADEPRVPDTGHCDEADRTAKHRPPVKATASLRSIISKFNRQREAVLHEQSLNTECSESESEEHAELPSWLRAEIEVQNSTVREGQGGHPRPCTPETMMESLDEGNQQSSSLISSSSSTNKPAEPSNSSPKDTARKHVAFQSDAAKDSVSSKEASNSTSSGDINVEIKFSKGISNAPSNRRPCGESAPVAPLDQKSPNKDSSSTSYYSPPDKLSPQQLSLLSGILSRVSVKNRNPVLHHYINRVLEMSHHSVSELDVSSSSELSIQSDIFKKMQSTPLKPVLPRRNLCFKGDNSSTAVSISSAPRDSVGDVSSSDNAIEIAARLRNILELQRLYHSATSSDPFSDSLSSYHGVPEEIGGDRCGNKSPAIGPVRDFCEDTGIFESQKAVGQPLFYTISDKERAEIDLPCELFPKPIFGVRNRQTTDNLDRRLDDFPDGYAMRPEHDPISLNVPERRSSLFYIESEVSSIKSTPTKILGRRSASPASSATSDDKDSTVSGLSSNDFISSSQLQNNDLIVSTSDSTSDFEDVFQSLGLGWALTTLRRTRNAQNLPADDSSSKTTGVSSILTSSSDSKNSPSHRHSTPIKPSACPKPIMESSENDAVPSLTPPNLTLLCPNLQKSSSY